MFKFIDLFKSKEELNKDQIVCDDDQIVAPADGIQFDIEKVKDDVFSKKMVGDGVAFKYRGDEVTICSPANGKLVALFPTGHAFGVEMNNGIELLVHIGINTVELNGKGFIILDKKPGDIVKAGEPIVKVNLKELDSKYDMSTMLIVSNANGKIINFTDYGNVVRGQIITK